MNKWQFKIFSFLLFLLTSNYASANNSCVIKSIEQNKNIDINEVEDNGGTNDINIVLHVLFSSDTPQNGLSLSAYNGGDVPINDEDPSRWKISTKFRVKDGKVYLGKSDAWVGADKLGGISEYANSIPETGVCKDCYSTDVLITYIDTTNSPITNKEKYDGSYTGTFGLSLDCKSNE